MMNASISTLEGSLNVSDPIAFYNTTTGIPVHDVSQTDGRASRDLLYVIPGPVICVFGIVCNGLNMVVLTHKTLHESPYTYITALSVSDFTLLAISLFSMTTFDLVGTYFKAVFDNYVFFFFGNVCFNFGVWIIVAMTIERAHFVLRPLKANLSVKRTRIRVLIIFLLCIVLNISRLFCFEIISVTGNKHILSGTDFRKSRAFYKMSWVQAVVVNFIPLIMLTATNATMLYTLRKAQSNRISMTGQTSRAQTRDQLRMTRTLVAIVILFFICVTPSAFVDYPIAYALFGKGMEWDEYIKSPANQTLIYITNLLLFMNSSLNFILYCVFNRKFRAAMAAILGRLRHARERNQTHSFNSAKTFTTRV